MESLAYTESEKEDGWGEDEGRNGKRKAIRILDLGSKVDSDDDGVMNRSNAQRRTGTQPFMAMNLLKDAPPPHLYRHDLESFLYILIWATVYYDLPRKRQLETGILTEWEGTFRTNYLAKLGLITDFFIRRHIFEDVQEEFKPLIGWTEGLMEMFRKGVNEYNDNYAALQDFDLTTLGGHVTFEKFMQVIERHPRPPLN